MPSRTHRRSLTATAVSLNQPNKGSRMLNGAAQTREAMERLDEAGASLAGLQELYTAARIEWRRSKEWGLAVAAPNDKLPWGSIGNSVAYRRDTWTKLDKAQLKLPMPGRARPLSLPVVYLQHRDSGIRIAVISVHLPHGGQASRRTRAKMRRQLRNYCSRLDRAGIPWLLLGDFNDPRGSRGIRARRIATRSHVDLVVSSRRNLKVDRSWVVRVGVYGVISDHPMPAARLTYTRDAMPPQPRVLPRVR